MLASDISNAWVWHFAIAGAALVILFLGSAVKVYLELRSVFRQ